MSTYPRPFTERTTPFRRPAREVPCADPAMDLDETRIYPWIYKPRDAEPFDYTQVITAPVINVETDIIIAPVLRVPSGWAGTINRIANVYVGPGFVQGSGDIVWRILINNNPYKNYGNILVQFGTVEFPREIDGIIIPSDSQVRYTVTVNNAALLGGTFFVATLSGYFWKENYKLR